MAPLPPVRKRKDYGDVKSTDLVAAIFHDRLLGERDAMQPSAIIREAVELQQTGKSFAVFKDADGVDRWIAVSSTAYKDRDGEIVSAAALDGAVKLADATGYRGPLRFWHVPGLDIGDCDYQATAQDGRFLIESGTFRSPAIAQRVKAAGPLAVSIGFTHPKDEPKSGIFENIAIFERSITPQGRASNLFTRLSVKGQDMLTEEKRKEAERLFGGDMLGELLQNVATTDKAAQNQGVAYKDAPEWAKSLMLQIETLTADVATLKSSSKPVEKIVEEGLDDDEETDDEETDDNGEEMVAEVAEDMGGDAPDVILNEQEVNMIADAVVAKIAPLLDIESKVRNHYDELKSMLGGETKKKDDTLAELTQRVKELEGDLPRGTVYRPSLVNPAPSADYIQAMKDHVGAPPAGLENEAERAAYMLIYGDGQ